MSARNARADRQDQGRPQAFPDRVSGRQLLRSDESSPRTRRADTESPPAAFDSILGRSPEEASDAPTFFTDLNLDQIVAAIIAGRDEYDLKPFFHQPLQTVDDIAFRHEVMRDLEQPALFNDVRALSDAMRAVRERLVQAEKLRYRHQREHWFLDAVAVYCDAVVRLADDLSRAKPASRGLSAFADHVAQYAASECFISLRRQTKKLMSDLAAITYTVFITAGRVEVRQYDGQPDYSADVEATFRKFQQGAATEFTFSFQDSLDMNHIEAEILDLVTKLYPGVFTELGAYVERHQEFADPTITKFDREIQFYIAYLEHIERFKKAGLSFCYPRITRSSKEVYDREGFDLALAGQLRGEHAVPVCNDFHLKGSERIIVVSGPNQGGKTTFARTFGQLHYLASLGCPVPGRKAQLFLFDRLFTHFEREEIITNLRGKLQDDLIRIHSILERASPRSVIILNEIFTSTTFRDANVLSRKIAEKLMELDLLCVWVTFLDELASLSEKTVSMVSTVAPENPAKRTFKIVRRPADGLAYALSIAEKYRLTHDAIKERSRS